MKPGAIGFLDHREKSPSSTLQTNMLMNEKWKRCYPFCETRIFSDSGVGLAASSTAEAV